MENSIGKKIAFCRKQKGLTQEDVAEKLSVSPQAVSKWENDIACPDIMLLPELARLLGVTTDELLSARPVEGVRMVPESERKSLEELTLRVYVDTVQGDKVRVNLPMTLIKVAIDIGMKLPQVSGSEVLESIDFAQVLMLVEKGAIGNLVEVETADGDVVHIVVE